MKFGSMLNHLMADSKSPVPEVGMGATVLHWSDRDPYTVVEVKSPTTIVIQADNAKRVDTNGMSECQDYEYTPNINGCTLTVTKRTDGRWKVRGSSQVVLLGQRMKYHDFSF